jgi:hypothetical protein
LESYREKNLESYRELDQKEGELRGLVRSGREEIGRVVGQSEVLVGKLEEFEGLGVRVEGLKKQGKEYEGKQKRLEDEINRNSRYKRQLRVNETGIRKFTKEMIRILDSHDKENGSISFLQNS